MEIPDTGVILAILLFSIGMTMFFYGYTDAKNRGIETIEHIDHANSICSDLCGIWDMMFYETTKVSTSKDWFFCYCTTDDLTQKSFRVDLEGTP